jgi:CubicO group peptidase (beta-lactamase class C family)
VRRRRGASPSNWIDAPYNRWGFLHVRELRPTAAIACGPGAPVELPRAERDLSTFAFDFAGRRISLAEMLAETYTDGFLLIHDGDVLLEHYVRGMTPADTHLLMSASKSLTATLCGALVQRGALHTDDYVTDHLTELRGSAWEGCTVQHLLDMRAGTRWEYEIDEYTILDVSGYRTHARGDLPADTATWIAAVDNAHKHGGPFRYCSLVADVLGWVLQRAGAAPFAELFSREMWSKIGAEQDAYVIVDKAGFAVVEGGICATLRDFGRFGLMCLQNGEIDGRKIVPAEWLHRLRVRDQELIDTFSASMDYDPSTPDAFYHDLWWIIDADRGVYHASGMNGQALFIHHPSSTVVAKLSTFPDALDLDLFAQQTAGIAALCESLCS